MLNIYIIVITAIIFAFCTAILLHQAIYSVYFRKKIALPHGFFEGIMTGGLYPLLLVVYCLIAVQFIFFVAFRNSTEFFLTVRLVLFALSILAFCVLKALTPPLLALWFGKSAFWDSKGKQGKHSYDDIYCAKVLKNKNSHVINNQQLYKITFFVKGKTVFLFPKKYICKLTAKQIGNLTENISFRDRTAKPDISKKSLIYAICLPILVFSIIFCCFLQAVSTGFLNAEKYTSSDTPFAKEISTVTEISDVISDNERIFVFYDKIGAINVYTLTGDFLYSVSLPNSVFKHSEICLKDGNLLYRYGNSVMLYSLNGEYITTESYSETHAQSFASKTYETNYGTLGFDSDGIYLTSAEQKTVLLERAQYLSVFAPSLIWPINMAFIIALFMLRYYVTKNDAPKKHFHQVNMNTAKI